MKRIFFLFIFFIYFTQPILAVESISERSAMLKFEAPKKAKEKDQRIKKLANFLEFEHSPLVSYAPLFVEKADKYDLFDWKLVPAITGVESTFGKAIPTNSYNAYGWANGDYTFKNWEESIDVVTKTLKERYVDRGLNTVEKIAPVYAPPSTTWARKVNYFRNKIENFASFTSDSLEVSI